MITREINFAIELIRHPERMDRSTVEVLKSAIERYPFYQVLYLLLLQNMYKVHDPEFGQYLKKYAVYLGDRSVLFYMIEGDNYAIPVQRLDEDSAMSDGGDHTLDLIDSFLRGIPDTAPTGSAPTLPGSANDYSAYLEQLPDFEGGEEELAATEVPSPVVTLASPERTAESPSEKTAPVIMAQEIPVTEAETLIEKTEIHVSEPENPITETVIPVAETETLATEIKDPTQETKSPAKETDSPSQKNNSPATEVEQPIFVSDVDNQKPEVAVPSIDEDEFTVASIRKHLSEDPDETPIADIPDDDEPKSAYFTETMAGIYIKQQKYEQALEIIEAISVDNPKKSVYFADQMRYLRLLIRINKNKK